MLPHIGWMLILFSCIPIVLSSQRANVELYGGVAIEFAYNPKGGSCFTGALSLGAKRSFRESGAPDFNKVRQFIADHLETGYQASLVFTSNGLGDNILEPLKRANIDFVNSFIFIAGNRIEDYRVLDYNFSEKQYDTIDYQRIFVKPMHDFLPQIVPMNYMNSIALGTNFILNNHGQNQRVGFANANLFRYAVLNYYNDGPPYSYTLGDGFDRWWTGGGGIDIYFHRFLELDEDLHYFQKSKFSLAYDRFTSDVTDAYEVGNAFGFYYLPPKNLEKMFYNRSRLKVGLTFLDDHTTVSYVRQGTLTNDIQDWIHDIIKNPIHYNYGKPINLFSVQYNNAFFKTSL